MKTTLLAGTCMAAWREWFHPCCSRVSSLRIDFSLHFRRKGHRQPDSCSALKDVCWLEAGIWCRYKIKSKPQNSWYLFVMAYSNIFFLLERIDELPPRLTMLLALNSHRYPVCIPTLWDLTVINLVDISWKATWKGPGKNVLSYEHARVARPFCLKKIYISKEATFLGSKHRGSTSWRWRTSTTARIFPIIFSLSVSYFWDVVGLFSCTSGMCCWSDQPLNQILQGHQWHFCTCWCFDLGLPPKLAAWYLGFVTFETVFWGAERDRWRRCEYSECRYGTVAGSCSGEA